MTWFLFEGTQPLVGMKPCMTLIPRFWRFVGWALMVPPHFQYNE
jgi:hypothetical protein